MVRRVRRHRVLKGDDRSMGPTLGYVVTMVYNAPGPLKLTRGLSNYNPHAGTRRSLTALQRGMLGCTQAPEPDVYASLVT